VTTTPLRVAFVGAGQMARQHLAAVERARTPAVPVGVYDPDATAAAALARTGRTEAFASIDALMAAARPDVVHVCSPPAAHVPAALAVLEAGAHVYVEKPFALTAADADRVLGFARERGRLVCAGHQLLKDPGFEQLMDRLRALGTLVQVDSHFAFKPSGPAARGGVSGAAAQMADILPHPLYSLLAVLERAAPGEAVEIAGVHARPSDLHATLRAGDVVGRLSVSLRGRPIASSLTAIGTGGTLACDFVRSIVTGAANAGTEPLEKIANPLLEAVQQFGRTVISLPARLRGGYAGLGELIDAFYEAIVAGTAPPIPADHLRRASALFEELMTEVDRAVASAKTRPAVRLAAGSQPLTVVTGASGFLGSRIVSSLPSVRGIARSVSRETVHQWVAADLARPLPPEALEGADVVIHAAAETAGGFDAHERNSVMATRHLLHAMHRGGVSRLVLVSSLSVVRPPRVPWERQDESTPRPSDPAPLGAYTWGKVRQEEIIQREAAALGIATRIIRPGALIDPDAPSLPGLAGRRLFGNWHLGLGRPSLPIAVCEVEQCARAIAWCATHFDDAPPIVNLFDPSIATRGALASWARAHGWSGRIVWMPISMMATAISAARTGLALAHGQLPSRLAAWSILRCRRFDDRLARALLDAIDVGVAEGPAARTRTVASRRPGTPASVGEPA
jgi:predicted dehydrogenase/nucleoside-diphosphate-sugar epimerase